VAAVTALTSKLFHDYFPARGLKFLGAVGQYLGQFLPEAVVELRKMLFEITTFNLAQLPPSLDGKSVTFSLMP
jgi:hypothetical protein